MPKPGAIGQIDRANLGGTVTVERTQPAHLCADDAGFTGLGTVGDLSAPVRTVPATMRAAMLDEMFRADEGLRWVALVGLDPPVLVERSGFATVMSGRLGYGRLLHGRRELADLPHPATVVVPDDTPVALAAATLIEDRPAPGSQIPDRREGFLVRDVAGGLRVTAVGAVFERLATYFAHQATHDPMTGLPNRLQLMQRLADAGRRGQAAVLLFIDLDRFKDVNDLHGHAAGDQVLAQFGERLRRQCRAEDLVTRLGGDEFAVLGTGAFGAEDAGALAQRLVLEAAVPFTITRVDDQGRVGELDVQIGASIGVAHTPAAGSSGRPDGLEVLLTQADLAMYRAKQRGRGRVEHFDEQLLPSAAATAATVTQRSMERRLRAAIDEDALTLHFQPVVALPHGRVEGVEALARWTDPDLGAVPPDQFIPLAERTGLILDLGRWVLDAACRQAAAWDRGPDGPSVAVNVSPIEIAQPGIVAQVARALAASGLPASRLCLEVTETAAVEDLALTAQRLRELSDLGVRIALDDFGTGYSSLTMLRELPVDIVKIDRSFVQQVATSAKDAVLVRLVIDTAHSLGMTVCAEGVEEAAQAQQLVALGCDTAQGWFYARPAPTSPHLAWALRSQQQLGTPGHPGTAPPLLAGSDEMVLVSTAARVITYASATSRQVLGRAPADLVGTLTLDLLHDDDRPAAAAVGIGAHEPLVHRARHGDGGYRWLSTTVTVVVDESGEVTSVLSLSRDVTEVVVARLALERSQQQFRLAFDHAPIGMALTRVDGTFVLVNAAFERLVGRTDAELSALRVRDITHPDDRGADESNLAEVRSGATCAHHVDKRYVHADGTVLPVSVSASLAGHLDDGTAYLVAHVLQR